MMRRKKLRAYRETLELRQEDLAKLVGVTKATVSYWETGRGSPSIARIPALAEALGLSVEECVTLLIDSKNPS